MNICKEGVDMLESNNLPAEQSSCEDRLLDLIVKGDTSNEEINKYLLDKNITLNQIKLFKLAQAKKELSRVLMFTRMLQKIEDSYSGKLMQAIEDDAIKLEDYAGFIDTINSMISRSNAIISSVLKDDTLANIVLVNNTNIHSQNNNLISSSPSLGTLTDPDSRDRVMKTVNNVMNILNQISSSETVDTDIPREEDGLANPDIQSDLGEIYIPYQSDENGDKDE